MNFHSFRGTRSLLRERTFAREGVYETQWIFSNNANESTKENKNPRSQKRWYYPKALKLFLLVTVGILAVL